MFASCDRMPVGRARVLRRCEARWVARPRPPRRRHFRSALESGNESFNMNKLEGKTTIIVGAGAVSRARRRQHHDHVFCGGAGRLRRPGSLCREQTRGAWAREDSRRRRGGVRESGQLDSPRADRQPDDAVVGEPPRSRRLPSKPKRVSREWSPWDATGPTKRSRSSPCPLRAETAPTARATPLSLIEPSAAGVGAR